jgi:hypothetical protein
MRKREKMKVFNEEIKVKVMFTSEIGRELDENYGSKKPMAPQRNGLGHLGAFGTFI